MRIIIDREAAEFISKQATAIIIELTLEPATGG